MGDCLDILETDNKLKVHIHTNFPELVKDRVKNFYGLEFSAEKINESASKKAKKPLGLVVCQTADLPEDFLKKHQIEEIPIKAEFPGGEILSGQNFFLKMKEMMRLGKKMPITSQPSIGDFVFYYKKALANFDNILVIVPSCKLSGTYSSARIARSTLKKPVKLQVFVFDCFSVEVAEGIIAMQAQKLINKGKKAEEIVNELKNFCPRVKFLGLVEDLRYVVKGGRLRLPGFLMPLIPFLRKIRVRLLLTLKNGRVGFQGIKFGKDSAGILLKEIEKLADKKEIQAAIAHADNLKAAEALKEGLEKRLRAKVLFVSSVSPVVGAHAGPGALIAAFYTVD